MTAHDTSMVRPDGYTVAFTCACGWASDTVPSSEGFRAGAQALRHLASAVLGEPQP